VAESPVFESPIVKEYPLRGDGALVLCDESSTTKLVVRAAAGTTAARQLGVLFGSSRADGDVLVCGQRPGEWLIIGPAVEVAAVVDHLDRSGHVSVIDHTHARALFRLTGRDAPVVLAKVCSLDLDDAITPDGAVGSASVADVNCDIARQDRTGDLSYIMSCDRSFAQYLFDAILDAGHEFGIGARTG
jgi:sarcosine oxidase, subunit alpha